MQASSKVSTAVIVLALVGYITNILRISFAKRPSNRRYTCNKKIANFVALKPPVKGSRYKKKFIGGYW